MPGMAVRCLPIHNGAKMVRFLGMSLVRWTYQSGARVVDCLPSKRGAAYHQSGWTGTAYHQSGVRVRLTIRAGGRADIYLP